MWTRLQMEWQHVWRATLISLHGLKQVFKNETAFRQEIIICVILIPLACYVTSVRSERALLIASLLLVLIVEVINSAIEAVVNRIGKDFHPLAGLAKDLGSTAVFLSILNVIVMWAVILIP